MIPHYLFYSKELTNPVLLREVESSNLDCIGYDAWTGTLNISFGGTTVYQYTGVPSEVLTEMLNSALDESVSIGSKFHQLVKDKFTVAKFEGCVRIPITAPKIFEENE